ncbi:hypothetical protein EVJ58_g3474 [Rhodofomes roseus]|uniref:Carboxylic ester hydrolase n=1 Tax=Rhodofomes roseus TaxID=34475 RepID=A0A4Y9YMN0_9APHY|nr:hypothetical protein EVJ58_g3474 [Rhodofomes roseus]
MPLIGLVITVATLLFIGALSVQGAAYYADGVSTNGTGPMVDVGYAAFLGNASVPGVHFFGGIRYAQPPLGELRWRPPAALNETPTTYKSVTDAQWFGDICLQQPAQVGFGSDDCLTLNVWKPAHARAGDNLPVALYIHGGGNYYASAQGFPMATWVQGSGGDIVAVNIQYRLGLLGFLASDVLMENGTANVGLLDQRAAIQWVQRHIAAFGGNPDHVTVVGESAGAADIVYQMIAYGGQGEAPFQAAITQSIGTDPIPDSTTYEYCFANVAATVGCPDNSTETMPCLRAAPLSAIVAAVNGKPSACKYLPIIDEDFLPDYPSTLIREGKFHKMPFIGGHCTDDGSIFVGAPSGITNTTDGFIAALRKRYTTLSNFTAARVAELYPADEFNSTYERAKTAFGDTVITCQDWFIAKKLQSEGIAAVYNYRWNTPDPVQLAKNPWEGVMHTSDLFFLFNGTNSGPYPGVASSFAPFNVSEQALSTEATGYWTSFSRSFNPAAHVAIDASTGALSPAPLWPASTSGRLVIQEGEGETRMEAFPLEYEERCLFWNEVGPEIHL